MVQVRLQGLNTPFGTALEERLERVGIETNSTDGISIGCWDSEAQSPENEIFDLFIRPSNSPKPNSKHKCTLTLHDLYIPSGVENWGPTEITDRLQWLESNTRDGENSRVDEAKRDNTDSQLEAPTGSPRHWVHIRDAVDAVAALLEDLPSGRIDMCGRRCWSHHAMCLELDMLWGRYQAAVDHSFKIEHLVVSEPKTEPTEKVERPNLAQLHAALEAVGTMGWHPLVPFRVGLMECLAHSFRE
uniref:Uncharacterized protein n=1 Tax=uncultured marine group II/III euryarchaeote KM3_102_D05 TaxID=1457845 RepID=A0A075G5W1_9EURY|nr:hypothetical protein [uncultured marine group II/III euryarchaeote KM3_102_D05]